MGVEVVDDQYDSLAVRVVLARGTPVEVIRTNS
ncbi:unannotated protein [freshwater metagenome]|uniref:Unannotated protein n=1 Tax=freshwater metagenome TaxID=449393 RepID=A0A6J6ZDG0_9ZZZZ